MSDTRNSANIDMKSYPINMIMSTKVILRSLNTMVSAVLLCLLEQCTIQSDRVKSRCPRQPEFSEEGALSI